jgi:NADH:ubiquinone reductase (H+-translocating)
MKKIVIIGAGYAGILTAKKLAKKFKNKEEVSIQVIDRNSYHTMLTELHEVAASRVDEDSIKISLAKVFAGRNVDVVMDNISSIDFQNKKVLGAVQEYDYDYLVMASGSKPTYFGIKGAAENAFNLWSFDDAITLKERIENSFRKAAVQPNIEKRKKLLTFYVVGAGFTGVEMAGELAEYAPLLCKKHGIPFEQVSIVNVDMLPRVVPILPEKLSNKVENRLIKMGVTVMLNTGVMEIGPDYIDLKVGEETTRHNATTVVWAAGIQSADIAYEAGNALPMIGRGRLKTDAYLRAEGKEDVYIVGDNMFYVPEGQEAPVPQMVENCEHSASTAAHNITASIKGGTMEAYKPSFHGVMVCVGGRYGVARVGLPKLMFNLPSFLAMLSKHFINIIYFMQVLGWNKVVSYCKHEFFTIRNKRSFVGGHFSNRTPSFLLVPLRIFLGMVWVFEGWKKIIEGWMVKPKLDDFFGAANTWFNSLTSEAVKVASSSGAEAATSATSGGGGGGGVSSGFAFFDFNIFEVIRVVFVSGKGFVDATLSDFALKIDFAPMTWFIKNFVTGHDGMQMVMQIGIVIAEILIGLALMGGLFTFVSSAASLVLQVMFVMTTGLYVTTFWMIFAAIAVLIGGGSTFGLDYYAIPAMKRGWGKLKFVRKWYFYHD